MPPLVAQPAVLPLRFDPDGSIRIGTSRVLLPVLINAYRDFGWSAEMLAQQFPTVTLAEIYGVLAYYLEYQAEVDSYVDAWNLAGEEARSSGVSNSPGRPDRDQLRQLLLARRAGTGS